MNRHQHWSERRNSKAFLALADGTILPGHPLGHRADVLGEAVFNTGLSGYQEILSDPSYAGQFVTMTYPEIGNTGMNAEDMESARCHASGFLIHELNETSNWRATESLNACLDRHGIPGLAGIDTRFLTTHLREHGTQKAFISITGAVSETEAVARARAWEGLDGQDYASRVSCKEPYSWDQEGALSTSWGFATTLPPADLKIVAYDFGIKWNILRHMRHAGMAVEVVPAKTPAAEVLKRRPHGVFLSNGPADPAAVTYAIEATRELQGKVPIMGICLGHQILSLACGGKTYRLKFGHHGCNHPVMNHATGRVEITSQNHNFAVDPDSLRAAPVEITHSNLNDGTVEGLRHRTLPAFSVQYHPEAAPGPHDPAYLFAQFREMIKSA